MPSLPLFAAWVSLAAIAAIGVSLALYKPRWREERHGRSEVPAAASA